MREPLAAKLCRMVRDKRLTRAGMDIPESPQDVLDGLPDLERRNWLDMADVVMELLGEREGTMRLRGLADDWDRYTTILDRDPQWRDEMRRAVVVEMRHTVEQLWEQCQ